MKLIRMTASFGKLDRAVLELGPGLNLLQAPNEGGKSTWAAFLRVMLYGLDTRDRDRKDHIADKNRYRPWSGGAMEGTLECEFEGRRLTIRRYTRGSSPMGAFQAVYTDTGEPVEGLTGENCGQMLTGVSREVFERSAFLRQSGLAVDQTPELERRIAALVTTGEEEVSYSQTEGRLREWLRRREYRGSGQIPRMEEELRRVEDTLEQLDGATGRILAARGELGRLEGERTRLEGELELHRRAAQRELDGRCTRAKEELDAARRDLEELEGRQARFGVLPERELLRQAQGELSYLKTLDEEVRQGERALAQADQAAREAAGRAEDPLFTGLTGDEAVTRAAEDLAGARAEQARARRERKKFPLLQACGLVLLVLALGLDLGLGGGLSLWSGVGVLAYLVLAGLSALALRRGKQAEGRAQARLARYGTQEPDAVTALAEDYRRRQAEAAQAGEEAGRIRTTLADRKARRENSRADILNFVRRFAPEVSDLFGCSAALSRALGLEEQMKLARTRLEGARRLYETLREQGGRELTGAEETAARPECSAEEGARRLAAVEQAWKQASRELERATGEQQTIGDPARVQARKEELNQALDKARWECRAIETALDALKKANARLQERFSPELNARAGRWMERLTGGNYQSVTLDRTLQASVEERDGVIPRPLLALSQGTVDQLYLAVRLAICEMVLPGDEPCPLVLDDALANFDDKRLALALDALCELARERQVLLFTCHSREEACLAGRPGVDMAHLQS